MESLWDFTDADSSLDEESTNANDIEGTVPPDAPFLSEMLHSLLLWSVIYNVSDNAITALLKTFKVFLTQMQQYLHPCPQSISTFVSAFPVSSSSILKYCSAGRCVPFRKGLAVCKKCFSVYDQDKMNPQYRTCIHQQGRSSKMCDEPLYQSGVRIPRPLCTYSYVSLIESLQAILSRPNMVELCNLWQQHNNSDPDLLCDVYDGLVWKELSMQYPSSLTDHTLSLGLALNVDWFQPFKHTRYSVGALYMSVLNIPRAYRFKSENVILVGIMPGPTWPKGA